MNHAEPLDSDEWKVNPKRKHKDTKHWCKGKVGREHVLETVESKWPYNRNKCGLYKDLYEWTIGNPYYENKWDCRHVIKCSVCGKHIKEFLSRADCPDG